MHSGLTHSVLQSLHRAGCGSAASIPTAAHAQPAARLLDKLSSLMLERRGRALLGRCLRLGARLCACLVYLAKVAFLCHQEGMASQFRVIPRPSYQLVSTTRPMLPHGWHVWRSCPQSVAYVIFRYRQGQGNQPPHEHNKLHTCLSSSAQTCGSAVA